MKFAEFLRIYPLRAPNVMWLLGAGASAASGVPTAGNMILDFKRRLYCAEQRISVRACEDIANPDVQTKIQRYLDSRGDCPPQYSEEEYSHYFSLTFPDEGDRRHYIDQIVAKATPSHGFFVLAILMKTGHLRLLWTTNFDRNIEDAAAVVLKSTSKLVVSGLDTPSLMREAINEGRTPALGKLHGDFQSRRLKNTSEELQTQDAEMRRQLIEACKRYGLIVAGYSGRDRSVMDALQEGIDGGKGYPSGLFWFSRSEPTDAARSLIDKAKSTGVQAYVIEVQTFDELLADIIAQFAALPPEDIEFLDSKLKRITAAPLPQGKGGWPVIRLNAVELISYPSVCRVVSCQIGGMKQVRDAVRKTGAKLVVARRKAGVLVFGSDAEVQKAFAVHQPIALDLYTIEPRRFWYNSIEAGLVYDALLMALNRERDLVPETRRGHHLLHVDPANNDSKAYEPLRAFLRSTSGIVPSTEVVWAEAIEINLSYRLDRLWLVFEPLIWISKPTPEEKDAAREFQRERQVTRYNRQWNDLIAAWSSLISGNLPEASPHFSYRGARCRVNIFQGAHSSLHGCERTCSAGFAGN
jgi:NAD-dependent SIR2 family protein deacetylase